MWKINGCSVEADKGVLEKINQWSLISRDTVFLTNARKLRENHVWPCESEFPSDLCLSVMRLLPVMVMMHTCISRCVLAWVCAAAGAAACVQVLLGRPCSACLWACACVFVCLVGTITQSQRVTLGLVPWRSPFALALVYLWTKGCSETNDLAPASQSRRTRDEKEKEVSSVCVVCACVWECWGLMRSTVKCAGN